MCDESNGSKPRRWERIGIAGDSYYFDLVHRVGQNPRTNHPRMPSALEQTACNNHGQIVAINPLPDQLPLIRPRRS